MIAHDALTALCAFALGPGNMASRITPCDHSNDDCGPYNPSWVARFREGGKPTVTSEDPNLDENEYYPDRAQYSVPNTGGVPWVEVLSLYSAEPDWGMDDCIRLSPLQRLMGGSQGYRHMRYKLFCLRVGMPQERALCFHRLADSAFKKGDIYWGVRYSARALHYIQDILSPFHTKPFPEWYLFLKLFHPRELYYTTYNYHLNFERLMGYHLWHGEPWVVNCIEDAGVRQVRSLGGDLLRVSGRVRRLSYPLFRECRRLWGRSMGSGFYKITREEIERLELPLRLTELTCRWLEIAASFVKGYIRTYVLPFVEGGKIYFQSWSS